MTEYTYLVGDGYRLRGFVPKDVTISLVNSRSVVSEVIEAECKTKSVSPPVWFFSRDLAEGINYAKEYQMNVFVHVVRTSAGIGYNKATVSSRIITDLNTTFANTNISFALSGSDYIDSDDFINMDKAEFDSQTAIDEYLSIDRVANAINIYVMSAAPNLYYSDGSREAGVSESIIGTAFLIVENSYMYTTLSHEMGHCLGLYHTHHGTVPEGGDSNECTEFVNGSNASICGDYIIDTPADPCLWGSNCNYIGEITDKNNDPYTPIASNMMSYAGATCRTHFSQKQVERMHQVLDYSNAHQLAATITNREITGPTQIGTASSYEYTIDVPSNAIVLWSIDCASYNSASSSAVNYTTSGTGSTITLENRYPNALSQKYVINATIYIGSGNQCYEYFATKTIYKISNPTETGTLTWNSESPCGDYLGTINMSTPNNSTIKIHKGGILTFHYTDVCGAYSYTDTDVFNFEIYNLNVVKEVGANHVFLIQPEATAPTNGKIMLSLSINGSGSMFQIPIEVLSCSQSEWMSVQDSTELDIMEIINKDELLGAK